MTSRIIVSLCAGLLIAAPAQGQIYKWTDARGTVHYSNAPPAGGASSRVDAVEERVTVYTPTVPAPPGEALRRRVDALEQELEAERGGRAQPARADEQRDEERARRELEECQRQRRVDCDKPEILQNGPPALVIVPARRRAAVVPTQPVPHRGPPKARPVPESSRIRMPG
jgi:hypothetical protein